MKITKTKLMEMIKEEITEVMGDMRAEVPVSTSAKDAMRASGGDDKALRKAIGDFVALGSPDRVAELAQAIEDYQYSDPYLVNLARDLLGSEIGQKAAAGRAEREKLAQQINERLDVIQEELKKVLNERFGIEGGDTPYEKAYDPREEGAGLTDLPPEAMQELSQMMNAPNVSAIEDKNRRNIIMNYFIDHLKEKYGV